MTNVILKSFKRLFHFSRPSHQGFFNNLGKKSLSAVLCASFFFSPLPVYQIQEAQAAGGTRTLWLHFTHTGEEKKITFRRNGKYDPQGIKEMQWILRDWRRNEATKMDPRLFDLIWSVYQESGATKPIRVVSGYRSKKTNNALRRRSRGVAKNSQHSLGKAMDFFIPGVPVKKLREIGLKMQAGGVGYYPGSRTPFVHMDTGRVRHWPRMTPKQLASVFPDGKTLHVSTTGKKQRKYAQALAEYNARKTRVLQPLTKSKRTVIASSERKRNKKKSGGLFANLFNGDDKSKKTKTPKQTPKKAPKVIAASVKKTAPKLTPKPLQKPIQAAQPTLVANNVDDTTPIPSRIGRAEEKPLVVAASLPPAPRALPQGLRENFTPPQAIVVANIPAPIERPAYEARLSKPAENTPQIIVARANLEQQNTVQSEAAENSGPQIIDPTKTSVLKRSDFNIPTPQVVKNNVEEPTSPSNQPETRNPIQLALKDYQTDDKKVVQTNNGTLAYASASAPIDEQPKLDARAFNQRFGKIDDSENAIPQKVIKKLTAAERFAALEIAPKEPAFSLKDLGLANKKSQIALRKSLGLDEATPNTLKQQNSDNANDTITSNSSNEFAFDGESKNLVSALMAKSSLTSKTHVKLTVPKPSQMPSLFISPSRAFKGSFKTAKIIDEDNQFKGETINITPTVEFTKTASTRRFSWLTR